MASNERIEALAKEFQDAANKYGIKSKEVSQIVFRYSSPHIISESGRKYATEIARTYMTKSSNFEVTQLLDLLFLYSGYYVLEASSIMGNMTITKLIDELRNELHRRNVDSESISLFKTIRRRLLKKGLLKDNPEQIEDFTIIMRLSMSDWAQRTFNP